MSFFPCETGDVSIILGVKVLNKVGPKSILGERSVLNSGTGEAAPCGATVTAASAATLPAVEKDLRFGYLIQEYFLEKTIDSHISVDFCFALASEVVVTLSASRVQLLDLFQKDPAILDHFQMRFDIERDRRGVTSFRSHHEPSMCAQEFRGSRGTLLNYVRTKKRQSAF